MRTIYKYVLPLTDESLFSFYKDSVPLSVQIQDDNICLWMLVENKSEMEERKVWIRGTGHDCAHMNKQEYVGTAQEADGRLIWHIFLEDKQ